MSDEFKKVTALRDVPTTVSANTVVIHNDEHITSSATVDRGQIDIKAIKYQAVKDFAEKLKENDHIILDGNSFVLVRFTKLDELVKEYEK